MIPFIFGPKLGFKPVTPSSPVSSLSSIACSQKCIQQLLSIIKIKTVSGPDSISSQKAPHKKPPLFTQPTTWTNNPTLETMLLPYFLAYQRPLIWFLTISWKICSMMESVVLFSCLPVICKSGSPAEGIVGIVYTGCTSTLPEQIHLLSTTSASSFTSHPPSQRVWLPTWYLVPYLSPNALSRP